MDIYSPKVLSDRTIQNFLPTRLAIKELAGQLYFCKSTRKDIAKYSGSGHRWKCRIKKYGRDNIKTLWISDWYHCPHEIQEVALHFSKENMIVESDRWANIKPENGLDGGSPKGTNLGRKFGPPSATTRRKLAKASTGATKSAATKSKISASSKLRGHNGFVGKGSRGPAPKEAWDKYHDTVSKRGDDWSMTPREQVTCPHCGKTGDISGMKRYHFDNCKSRSASSITLIASSIISE
jgi:hypothetical protein